MDRERIEARSEGRLLTVAGHVWRPCPEGLAAAAGAAADEDGRGRMEAVRPCPCRRQRPRLGRDWPDFGRSGAGRMEEGWPGQVRAGRVAGVRGLAGPWKGDGASAHSSVSQGSESSRSVDWSRRPSATPSPSTLSGASERSSSAADSDAAWQLLLAPGIWAVWRESSPAEAAVVAGRTLEAEPSHECSRRAGQSLRRRPPCAPPPLDWTVWDPLAV